jgi:hypothetical protein
MILSLTAGSSFAMGMGGGSGHGSMQGGHMSGGQIGERRTQVHESRRCGW